MYKKNAVDTFFDWILGAVIIALLGVATGIFLSIPIATILVILRVFGL